jgi:hypothetical protein
MQASEIVLFHGVGDLMSPVLATVTSLCKTFTYIDLGAPETTRIPVGAEGLVLTGIQNIDDDRLINLFRLLRASTVSSSSSSSNGMTGNTSSAMTFATFSFTSAAVATIKRIFIVCPTIDIYARARTLTSRLFSTVRISKNGFISVM